MAHGKETEVLLGPIVICRLILFALPVWKRTDEDWFSLFSSSYEDRMYCVSCHHYEVALWS